MTKIEKYRRGLGSFIASEGGQRFFNFAYSIGAAIVIWGALFKILHLPGGNTLLSVGMGTEVLMFVLTAFDRPPREYKWEKVFPVLEKKGNGEELTSEEEQIVEDYTRQHPEAIATVAAGRISTHAAKAAAEEAADVKGADIDTAALADSVNGLSQQLAKLSETTAKLNEVSDVLLQSYAAVTQNSESIIHASKGYVEQMKDLDRNIGGLNTIYEIQLKSVSSQLESIDRVNRGIKDIRDMYEKSASQSGRYCEETEKMARYMQQLNSIYEKMIAAMTVNMYRPGAFDISSHSEEVRDRENVRNQTPNY